MAMTAEAVTDRVVVDARAALAAEVRALMGRHRVNQKRLAKHLGRSQAAVSRRLSGEMAFDADDLIKITGLFGTSISELTATLRSRCFDLLTTEGYVQTSFGFDRSLASV